MFMSVFIQDSFDSASNEIKILFILAIFHLDLCAFFWQTADFFLKKKQETIKCIVQQLPIQFYVSIVSFFSLVVAADFLYTNS